MASESVVFAFAAIFTGAAVLATLTLYARQSLLVAYIVLGCALGPWGVGLVGEHGTIEEIGNVGIIFLLFLLGLNLHPQKLLKMLREATTVTLSSSVVFAAVGWLIAAAFSFSRLECLVIGAAMMFSSTILGLKLLPATALHHRHMGEAVISILLLQDIIAIIVLLVLEGARQGSSLWGSASLLLVALPGLVALSLLIARYVLERLIMRFDTIREYVFVLAIGWCLGIAQLGNVFGLSYEIGAFIAGVALATSPISFYISESLRPLRDFFLIMFFFSLGAALDLALLWAYLAPAAALAVGLLAIKPLVFRLLLTRHGESREFSTEIGVRLGQISEFALLIAVVSVQADVIGERAATVVQSAAILSFVISAYVIMWRYPTPIAVDDSLRRD